MIIDHFRTIKEGLFRIPIFLFLTCISLNVSFGQYEKDYIPLKCKGEIPIDFTSLISDNYQNDITEVIDASDSRFEKKSKDEFVKISYTYLQEILGSGKVLFGDPVTTYLNEVKDLLLTDQPQLKEKIRIYTLKSSVPNAMATDPGIIFVTTGLLALFENEAELAYVLSHEISHVVKKHSIDQYIEDQKIINRKKEYRHNSFQDAILAMSAYSQTQEYEADLEGAKLFMKSAYAHKAMPDVFNLLAIADFPYDEERFDFSQLESDHFTISDSIKNFQFRELTFEDRDEEKEQYYTHPHSDERRTKIEAFISEQEDIKEEGSKFLISKERFFDLRQRCRFEVIELNLVNQEYIRAISHISVLQKEFPKNNYLKRCLAKAFYGLYKVKRHLELKDVQIETNYSDPKGLKKYIFLDPDESMGYEHITVIFLKDVELEVLNSLALKLFLDIDEDYSSYTQFEMDIAKDLRVDHGFRYRSIPDSESAKYQVLFDHKSNERLKNALTEAEKETSKDKEPQLSEKSKLKKKQEVWLAYTNTQLGIDTLITITPFYLRTSERKGDKYLETEEIQLNYSHILAEESKEIGIHNSSFNPLLLNDTEVEKFNDLSDLNEWFLERFSIINIDMLPLSSDFVQDEVEKYGTSKLLYTGVYSEVRKKDGKEIVGPLLIGALCFPVSPFMIYIAASPYHETFTFYYVFDFKTGKMELDEVTFFERLMDSPILIESQMNEFLSRIHSTPSKKMPH